MIDIKQQEDGDIEMAGDIQYSKCADQHKLTVLMSAKGEIKNRPDVGVGIVDYLLDSDNGSLLREARRQCQRIGMKITAVYFKKNNLMIEGGYD